MSMAPLAISNATQACTRSKAPAKRSTDTGAPSMRIRSVGSARCGEVKRPVRRPAARRADSNMAQTDPLPFGHGRPIDADTLGGFGEMRRGEKAGAPAGRPQSRFQHGADGSLAVRTRAPHRCGYARWVRRDAAR